MSYYYYDYYLLTQAILVGAMWPKVAKLEAPAPKGGKGGKGKGKGGGKGKEAGGKGGEAGGLRSKAAFYLLYPLPAKYQLPHPTWTVYLLRLYLLSVHLLPPTTAILTVAVLARVASRSISRMTAACARHSCITLALARNRAAPR